ncbi:hypothetical protein M8C21_021331, partial [Ambrosia artemisiifolia]
MAAATIVASSSEEEEEDNIKCCNDETYNSLSANVSECESWSNYSSSSGSLKCCSSFAASYSANDYMFSTLIGGMNDEEIMDWDKKKKTNNKKQFDSNLSEIDMMKEKFAKLLLGEDMSGGGKGVCTALAISNAITNLSVPPDGLSEDAQKRLQQCRDCTNQILKAALAINSNVLVEMEIPNAYLDSLPK